MTAGKGVVEEPEMFCMPKRAVISLGALLLTYSAAMSAKGLGDEARFFSRANARMLRFCGAEHLVDDVIAAARKAWARK